MDSEMTEQVREALQREPRVRTIDFSTREQKAADSAFREMFEHEFEEILEENPLLDSFEVQLAAPSGEEESVEAIIARLEQLEGVERVSYPDHMAERLYRTVGKIRFVLILFGGALLVISLILLANTIRLAIYSKRYLINTMKLVGASKGFIMRPFLWDSFKQGLVSGLIATALFMAMIAGLNSKLPDVMMLAGDMPILIIVGAMMAGGVVISLLFTTFALNKFINMNTARIHLY